MDEIEILKLINPSLLAAIRRLKSLPDPPKKADWVRLQKEMAVHARRVKPAELLLKRRPNEDEEVHEYRLENYEAITYPSMLKAFDNIFRVFNGLNYSIKGTDDLKNFIAAAKIQSIPLRSWMEQVVSKRMIEDPNGLLVWLPSGEGVENADFKVVPRPYLVYTEHIRYFEDRNIIFCSDEMREVEGAADDTESRYVEVYYALDELNFYKVYSPDNGDNYNIEFVYRHEIDYPFLILGGDINGDGYYESFFAPFLPFGNEAIRQFSDWQAIMTTSAFPFREVLATQCTNPNCLNGHDKGTKERCTTCGGNGMIMPSSPYGVYLRQPPTGSVVDNTPKEAYTMESMRFISPDVGIVKNSGDAWEMLIKHSEKAIHINYIDEAQSGTAKDIDRDGLYAMLTKISGQYFDVILLRSAQIIERYLNPSNVKPEVSILRPFDFRIKTEADLIDDINSLSEGKAPMIFVIEAIRELSAKRFANNLVANKTVSILMEWDALSVYTTDAKIQMVINGLADKATVSRGIFGYMAINQIINEMSPEKFLETDNKTIIDRLNVIVDELMPKAPIPIVDNNGV